MRNPRRVKAKFDATATAQEYHTHLLFADGAGFSPYDATVWAGLNVSYAVAVGSALPSHEIRRGIDALRRKYDLPGGVTIQIRN